MHRRAYTSPWDYHADMLIYQWWSCFIIYSAWAKKVIPTKQLKTETVRTELNTPWIVWVIELLGLCVLMLGNVAFVWAGALVSFKNCCWATSNQIRENSMIKSSSLKYVSLICKFCLNSTNNLDSTKLSKNSLVCQEKLKLYINSLINLFYQCVSIN